jgi:hypothetical protein
VSHHEQPFKIHRELICLKSTYFKAVCHPDNLRKEGGRYPRVPEVEATAFQAYVEWVYTSKVNVDISMADKVPETDAKHKALFALYNLGEELGDVKLRKKVMDYLVFGGLMPSQDDRQQGREPCLADLVPQRCGVLSSRFGDGGCDCFQGQKSVNGQRNFRG